MTNRRCSRMTIGMVWMRSRTGCMMLRRINITIDIWLVNISIRWWWLWRTKTRMVGSGPMRRNHVAEMMPGSKPRHVMPRRCKSRHWCLQPSMEVTFWWWRLWWHFR